MDMQSLCFFLSSLPPALEGSASPYDALRSQVDSSLWVYMLKTMKIGKSDFSKEYDVKKT